MAWLVATVLSGAGAVVRHLPLRAKVLVTVLAAGSVCDVVERALPVAPGSAVVGIVGRVGDVVFI